jgi:hypothetical protein
MTDDPTPTTPTPGGQPQALTDDERQWGAESDAYLRALLDAHTPSKQHGDEKFTGRCMYCSYTIEPCDTASAAAAALVRSDALTDAQARAAHFESLAKDQQTTNEAMVVSLQRGLAELKTSEAECARAWKCVEINSAVNRELGALQAKTEAEVARLRDDCAALLKILDATYDGPIGRFTRDRIGAEIAAADRGRAPAGEAGGDGR